MKQPLDTLPPALPLLSLILHTVAHPIRRYKQRPVKYHGRY